MNENPNESCYFELIEIMRRLRDPEAGCAWDLKQNHETLIPYLEEESREVIEAIRAEDDHELADELGDLFLQILFHAQVATERGAFNLETCLKSLRDKLVHRHPHIFREGCNRDLDTPQKVHAQWNRIKEGEKLDKIRALGEGHPFEDALKVQELSAALGFEFENAGQVRGKILEELEELDSAAGEEKVLVEAGDLLFSVINYLRFQKINPRKALRASLIKFRDRFLRMKEQLEKEHKLINGSSLDLLDGIWNELKKEPADSKPLAGPEQS